MPLPYRTATGGGNGGTTVGSVPGDGAFDAWIPVCAGAGAEEPGAVA